MLDRNRGEKLSTKHDRGFWVAGFTAFFLSCISYLNQLIVIFFNKRIFHVQPLESPGWWLYILLRITLFAFLIWTVVGLPRHREKENREPQGDKDGKFFDPLMGLRALACMLVIIGHYFITVFPFQHDGVHRYIIMFLSSPPWTGVWIFFTLSGFLMGKAFAKGRYTLDSSGYRLFLRNRMLRIVPIYYAGILVVGVYRYPAVFQPKNLWMLIEVAIFDFRGDLPINPIQALWSVSTEVQFYLLTPFLMLFLLRLREKAGTVFTLFPIALLCITTSARFWVSVHSPENVYSYIYTPLISNLDIFIAGMSVNLLPRPRNILPSIERALGPLLFAAGTLFYFGICYVVYYYPRFHLGYLMAKGPAICVLFAGAFIYVAEIRGRILIKHGLVGIFLLCLQAIGTLTYCLYVFHSDIFLSNADLLPRIHNLKLSLMVSPVAIGETFAVAAFFYFAVERPFDRKKRVSGTALLDAP